MKAKARRPSLARRGVVGTARVGRPTSSLLAGLRQGDVAVIDHVDLDRDTATALVDAGVRAVVNAAPMISGRYANLGPEVLAEAGVVLVDRLGGGGIDRVADGRLVRIHEGVIYAAEPDSHRVGEPEELARGRALDLELVRLEMERARGGLTSQLDGLGQATSEFLRREQELLHGRRLPAITTAITNRPVVVVARGDHADLQAVRPFVREQAPVVIAVGAAANDLLGLSWVPDVLIVTAGDPGSVPSADALRIATDVVLVSPPGSGPEVHDTIEALSSAAPLQVETTATAEDLALLLADRGDATVIVAVGLHDRLEDFLDQATRASTFVTRLKVGDRLVDAAAVRSLYTDRSSSVQLLLVVLAGLIALVAAIAVTPVGQDSVDVVVGYLRGVT